MKKLSLFALLGASLVLVGCGTQPDTKTPGTTTDFTSAVCNDYFNILNCTLETQIPADQQAEIITIVEQTKQDRLALDEATQEATCQAAWDTEIVPQAELYNSFGCTVPTITETTEINEVEITTDEVITETTEEDGEVIIETTTETDIFPVEETIEEITE